MSSDQAFWDVADPLLASGRLEEGTIMSSRCVRADGEFVAMPFHQGDGLVVKLPRDRVTELIESGIGGSFAPAGRVFKEWVHVVDFDERLWTDLLEESVAFVT